jgi:hypothetical protein
MSKHFDTTKILKINGVTLWHNPGWGKDYRSRHAPIGKHERPPEFTAYYNGKQSLVWVDADRVRMTEHMLKVVGITPFRSRNGNIKGVFIINHPRPSVKMVYDTLKSLLGDFVDNLDMDAIFHSFVPVDEWEQLSLQEVKVIEPIWDSHDWEITVEAECADHPIKNKLLSIFASDKRPGGIERGMELSCRYAAEQLGIAQSTANKYLSLLVEDGWIEVMNKRTSLRHAIHFKLTDKAVEKIFGKEEKGDEQKKSWWKRYPCVIRTMGPQHEIESGCWWRDLLPNMRFFKTWNAVLGWFKSLAGHDMPGKHRLSKLVSAWNHHAKRNNLALAWA